jgi:microcystin-dependent protein
MDPYIGEIRLFAGNFAPRGWALCNGQLLPIAQNVALFSILGTTYGGDGIQTFALPDLRGRAPVHMGRGPGLAPVTLGQARGSETVTLVEGEMPGHTHQVLVAGAATDTDPVGAALATSAEATYGAAGSGARLDLATVLPAGGGQPHENMQPYLAVNFIIALEGIFPARN